MAEAKLNREYALRVLGVGLLMFGMCVWSVYDGKVKWPGQNVQMDRVRPALLTTNLTVEAWLERDEAGDFPLAAAFRSAGFSQAPSKLVHKLGDIRLPKRDAEPDAAVREAQAAQLKKIFQGPVYGEHDLKTQFVQAGVTFVLGVLAWLSVAQKRKRVFVADERGLSGSGFDGAVIPYAEIKRIDWSRWDEKGILMLTLQSGTRHKLDGWHFAGMAAVAEELKKHRPDLCA